MLLNHIFYTLKPLIPRRIQINLRRRMAGYKRRKYAHIWPIDPNAATPPPGWRGWPEGKQFALVLSHDVDTRRGYENVLKLAELEESMGFRSQFNFVPERYGKISLDLLDELRCRGFGIGVHGLKHDGKLFRSKATFDKSAPQINYYLRQWGTRGFTAPSMIRNHKWMHDLEMDYCTSTFDTDPFEPQLEGAGTIFPYWVRNSASYSGFLELPYTLVQDYTLFVILGENSIDIWKHKIDWIASNGGMALLNSHPDYMDFERNDGEELYPVKHYIDFLKYVQHRYKSLYFHALPSVLASRLPYDFLPAAEAKPKPKSRVL